MRAGHMAKGIDGDAMRERLMARVCMNLNHRIIGTLRPRIRLGIARRVHIRRRRHVERHFERHVSCRSTHRVERHADLRHLLTRGQLSLTQVSATAPPACPVPVRPSCSGIGGVVRVCRLSVSRLAGRRVLTIKTVIITYHTRTYTHTRHLLSTVAPLIHGVG